ncbi:MAG TPA: 3D domain-containing protein [Vicinamibacterales bacterium]
MLISRSLGRKLAATASVALGFVLMYEATVMDFRDIPRLVQSPSAQEEISLPSQASHLRFAATAYCKGTTTASGVNVRTGIAAADPDLLPVGSVIQVYKLGERYNGIYTIMDTGPAVQGRHIDIYMWSCNEALELGRRDIAINVLRLGWNPKASTPTLVERLFRQREAAQRTDPPTPLPSRPIEIK